jgi:hypothetical protein
LKCEETLTIKEPIRGGSLNQFLYLPGEVEGPAAPALDLPFGKQIFLAPVALEPDSGHMGNRRLRVLEGHSLHSLEQFNRDQIRSVPDQFDAFLFLVFRNSWFHEPACVTPSAIHQYA